MSRSTRLALAFLSASLNGAGFIFYGPLVLVANVPLLAALDGAPGAAFAALLGAIVGFFAGLHIYGVVSYGWFIFWSFGLYCGSQMLVYALLHRALWGRLGAAVDVALPALVWTLTEWMRTVGPLSMPSSYVGCIADVAWLRPWLALAPWTGGLGVSTAVALTQSVVFHGLLHRRTHGRAVLGAVAVLGGLTAFGIVSPPPLGDRQISVAGVQGGLANWHYEAAMADPAAQRDVVRTFEALTRQAYDRRVDLVVWPETAVRAPVLDSRELRARLFPGEKDRSVLVAGTRYDARSGAVYNLATAVAPPDNVLGHYAKVRLVPAVESSYVTPGDGWDPLETPVGSIGVMICLESVYPDIGRALAEKGAELLVVQSNDAGFGHSPITAHVTNRAIVRAVETGRWLMRVGQAGITTLVDPRGATHGRLGLFEPGVLYGEARLRSDRTLYVRWGDWWMGVVAFLLMAAFVSAWLTTKRNQKTGRNQR